MANKDEPKLTEEQKLVLPDIENADTVEATFESCMMYLFLAQDKFSALNHNPLEFINGFSDIQAYKNVIGLWSQHLGPAPTLLQLCQQYWIEPKFKGRLEWFTEGAQLPPSLWDPEDDNYQGDVVPVGEGVEGGVHTIPGPAPVDLALPDDMLTPEVEMRPQISTGDERVGPEDDDPFQVGSQFPGSNWTAAAWGDELEQQADAEFGDLSYDDQSGEVFNTETGELVDKDALDPPSWLSQGGWATDSEMKAVESGDSAQEQDPAEDTGEEEVLTLVCGFNTAVAMPSKPCTAKEWNAYVAELKRRYMILVDSEDQAIKRIQKQRGIYKEAWELAKGDKSWKK